MKKFSIALVSVALMASSAFAGGIGGGFGGGNDDGLKVDVFGSNSAPILNGVVVGKIGVGEVDVDVSVEGTSVAVTSDIEIDGPKVDSVKVVGQNGGIVANVVAVGKIGAGDVGGSVVVKGLAAGVASSISIKD